MIELTEDPIDTTRLLEAIADPTCGGEVLFVGTTRRWTVRPGGRSSVSEKALGVGEASGDQGTSSVEDLDAGESEVLETEYLLYEAYHEMALRQMSELAHSAQHRWPVRKVAIVHRLGRVDPLEASVAVAVSSPHRREAFEAASWLMDEIKHNVPIWKQEHYVQNAAEWIHPTSGSCSCGHSEDKRTQTVAATSDPTLERQRSEQLRTANASACRSPKVESSS